MCIFEILSDARIAFYLNEDEVNTDNVRWREEKESIVGQMSIGGGGVGFNKINPLLQLQ